MDKPTKPRRPKPILSKEEKRQQEFDRKVADVQRRMNEAPTLPNS